MSAADWTDDRIEQLKTLWGEGLSASQIARAIGCGLSRNACIGKIHRLGLMGTAPARKTRLQPQLRALRPPKPFVVEPSVPAPEAIGTIGQIMPHTVCQYIHGDVGQKTIDESGEVIAAWRMCAQPGYPYCTYHHARCHDKAPAPTNKSIRATADAKQTRTMLRAGLA